MYHAHTSSNADLAHLLAHHPYLSVDEELGNGVELRSGDWVRQVRQGDLECGLFGLVELMDNNPLVCADQLSVPSAAATLALVTAGPALRAGIAVDEVMFASSLPEAPDLDRALSAYGSPMWSWSQVAPADDTVEMASALIPVGDAQDLAVLYEEAFARSFYVRLMQAGDSWHPDDVRHRPYAHLQLRVTKGDGGALLNSVAMADRNGKLGAAQLVHAMNVMCGFEESAGIPEDLRP